MLEFLLKARRDLKNESIEKRHEAIDKLFELAEENLCEAHEYFDPSFCQDTLLMSSLIKELVQHVSDYQQFVDIKESLRISLNRESMQ